MSKNERKNYILFHHTRKEVKAFLPNSPSIESPSCRPWPAHPAQWRVGGARRGDIEIASTYAWKGSVEIGEDGEANLT